MERYLWRILVIDDDEDDYLITRQLLAQAREGQFFLEWAASYNAGLAALQAANFDAVLVDYDLGIHTGIELIRETVAKGYPAPLLLLTGRGTYEVDVQAMEAGAADYLCKGEMNPAFLERAIRYAIERKKHERELRSNQIILSESEERYRVLFNTMLNGFALHEIICDEACKPVDYRFLQVNPAFEQLTGLSEAEIVGRTVREVLPKIDPFWIETYGTVALTGQPARFDKFFPPLGKHYEVYAFSSGQNQFATLFTDITERKQTEEALLKNSEALLESEERERARATELEALMDAFPAMIWISRDPQCRDMVGNRYGYEFLRMWEGANISKSAPDEALTRQPYRNLKDGQEIPQKELPMQIAAATGQPASEYEFDLVFADGVCKHVIGNVNPLFDRTGNPSGAVGVFLDITARKNMEKKLRESEERFRMALSNPSIAVFSTDQALRYTWFYSTAMGSMTERFIGKRDDEILTPECAAELVELKQRAIDTCSAVREEIQLELGGALKNLIATVEPCYDPQGDLCGVVGACFDVTDQRRLEAESIEHITQMEVHHRLIEYREKERQEIARDLHDGPVQDLSSLIFTVQVMKEAIRNPKKRLEFEQIVATLSQTVSDLREMINQLRPPSLIRFGVSKAIQHHAVDILERHPELSIELNLVPLDGENHLSEQVNLALFRIYQEAMNNILRHAKATKIRVRLRKLGDFIVLEVRDNGIGFPVSEALTKHMRSNHFGLAGMQERGDAVGGVFSASSESGKGTTIHVTIPLIDHHLE